MPRMPIIEPDLGQFEAPYRQAFLKSDAFQAIVVIGLSNLASLSLIRSDYKSLGVNSTFYIFLGARLIVFLISVMAIYVLTTSTNPKHHDGAVTSYMLAGALINPLINHFIPPSYVAYIGVAIVLLNINYFALFTPFPIRAAVSILFSAIIVTQAFQTSLNSETKTVIAGMHVLTNMIGLFISTRLYTHRRLSFKAHAEEMELKLELDRLASLDSLTNIKNRRAFSGRAIEEFERAKRYNRPVSLILIDLDGLKTVNDSYGHLAGDEVIKYCATFLSSQLRKQDILGRLGGDEFGILLPDTGLAESVTVGKRIRHRFGQDFSLSDGSKIALTLSLGVAEISIKDENFEDLFRHADQLLYKAKKYGRNRLVCDGCLDGLA